MTAIIANLIDKLDTNEIVRDKIAAILTIEKENQKLLAVKAGKNPANWDFTVFVERAKPWEVLSDSDGCEVGEMPLINVTFDNDSLDEKGSQIMRRQKARGIFFIDCFAHKNATNQQSGDEATSREADRIARLARNILMYAGYGVLDLKGLVSTRVMRKREKIQPDIRMEAAENIVVSRLTLEVVYEELSAQISPEELEQIFGECKLSETGQVLFDMNFT